MIFALYAPRFEIHLHMATALRILFRSLLVVSSSVCLFSLLLVVSYPFGIVADTSKRHLSRELLDWLVAGGLVSMIGGVLSLIVGLTQKIPKHSLLSIGAIILVGFMVFLFAVAFGTD